MLKMDSIATVRCTYDVREVLIYIFESKLFDYIRFLSKFSDVSKGFSRTLIRRKENFVRSEKIIRLKT